MFVDKMEFYIDENLKYTVTEPDGSLQWVTWKWDETIFFKHNLKVIAYDKMNISASDEIEVWIFNF